MQLMLLLFFFIISFINYSINFLKREKCPSSFQTLIYLVLTHVWATVQNLKIFIFRDIRLNQEEMLTLEMCVLNKLYINRNNNFT